MAWRRHTAAVIWRRWRQLREPTAPQREDSPFEDLIEEAPVAALLLDRDLLVVAANREARNLFCIDADRLPLGLVEATREANLHTALRAGQPETELRLGHRRRQVRTRVVPGPQPGQSLLFVTDVTELRRLERVRQEFVANLGHELLTPITSLRLAMESLQGDPPPSVRQEVLSRALREVDNLARVIGNLRQLAELETGAVVSRRDRFEVGGLIAEVLQRLDLTRPVGVDVKVNEVMADRSKLGQALANLVDNADKFSPPGSPIEVQAAEEAGSLVIRVRDHGPGIAPEHWDRVFERFYKVDPAHSRDLPGSGLGLALVRHLVAVMGGRAWTEAAPGGGQIFGISVPLTDSTAVNPQSPGP
jgi:two-component system phosphate regulon sensor histidine kinase PhoR